jgi:tRNA(Ile)-lysidine synthetase-like protein
MEDEIYNFWFNNPSYWIPITPKDKTKVDAEIYNKFYNLYKSDEIIKKENYKDNISIIIFNDQFLRHFQRYINGNCTIINGNCTIINGNYTIINGNYTTIIIDDDIIYKRRLECIDIALEIINDDNIFKILQEEELLFILMPLKHDKQYKYVLDVIIRYINKPLHSYTYLSKFFNDTYKKLYTLDKIKEGLMISTESDNGYTVDVIGSEYTLTDLVPSNTTSPILPTEKRLTKLLNDTLHDKTIIIVSLSGGIDSNVSLYLLNNMIKKRDNIKLVAVHLIYGNRKESIDEFEFVQEYCKLLDIELYYYKIEYLKRNEIEREFYEEMTRIIRFSLYKLIPSIINGYNVSNISNTINNNKVGIYLGHIKDDIIENIWTNLAKNQNIYNLQKMEIESIIDSVNIVRPFLQVNKEDIYELSLTYKIPYLKNTTPTWSNRGKFRNRFYKETHDQFGSSVDNKLIELSNTLKKTGTIIHNLVYKPIISSYKPGNSFNPINSVSPGNSVSFNPINSVSPGNSYSPGNSFSPGYSTINITRAIEAELDITGWQYIFEHVCHQYLHITKPSIHSIKQFIERIQKFKDNRIKIQMKINLQVEMDYISNQYILFFIYKN